VRPGQAQAQRQRAVGDMERLIEARAQSGAPVGRGLEP
jgi:hypothetical protein